MVMIMIFSMVIAVTVVIMLDVSIIRTLLKMKKDVPRHDVYGKNNGCWSFTCLALFRNTFPWTMYHKTGLRHGPCIIRQE